jgi:hypothetical protein
MKRPVFNILIWGCLLALPLAHCADAADETPAEKADTAAPLKTDLPSGRFQLPTRHTPAPDFWITLPTGYEVKSVGRLPNDEFYIYRSDDPTLRDSTAISPGLLRVYIGVNPQSGLGPGDRYQVDSVSIDNYETQWKIWTEKLPDGGTFYVREITADKDFFSRLSPDLANAPLHLHLYIAGSDSSRTIELAHAVETIATLP